MDTSRIDERLRETYERSAPVVNEATFEAQLRRNTSKSGKRAFAPRRTSALSVAVFASIAVVLVAAITVGSLEAVKHLGKDQPIVVIGDDNVGIPPGSTGQTSQPAATETSSAMFRGNLERTGVYPSVGPSQPPELVWKFKTGGAVTSSPVISDGVVYFGDEDGHLYAVEAESGREKWKFKAGGAVSPPAISDGLACFGSEGGILYAVDVQSGEEKWMREWMRGGGDSSPVVSDGVVYVGTEAVDLETGLLRWRVETSGCVGSCVSISDGVLYFGGSGWMNGLYAVDIDGDHAGFLPPFFPSPYDRYPATGIADAVAVSDGVAYFASIFDNRYLAVDILTGQEKWSFQAGAIPSSFVGSDAPVVSPAVSGGLLYCGSEGGPLYAVDIETGQERWRVGMDIAKMSSPAIAGEVLYVGSKDGYLHALDANTGQELWRFETGGAISSSPAISDGVVYFGSEDGYLYALK